MPKPARTSDFVQVFMKRQCPCLYVQRIVAKSHLTATSRFATETTVEFPRPALALCNFREERTKPTYVKYHTLHIRFERDDYCWDDQERKVSIRKSNLSLSPSRVKNSPISRINV